MKTCLKISRLTFLLGIAIWGNHAYAYLSKCNSSSDPLVISGSCEGLQVTSPKSAISVAPGVSVNGYFTYLPAVTIDGGASTTIFDNNGAINADNGS
jgi:hypothetical protein